MMKAGKDTVGRLKMPNYRIIVRETKTYFVEAANKEDAATQVFDARDIFDRENDWAVKTLSESVQIEEVVDVGSLVEKFGT